MSGESFSISITGNSNDSNLVLGSASGVIKENAVENLDNLTGRVSNLENNNIDISSCLGYYTSSSVPVAYHIHYDNNNELKYTILFSGEAMGISAEKWVQMWNMPLMEDKSRLRTLRTELALYMRGSGLPIVGSDLPSVRGYENRTLSFSSDYNTIYLDNGLRLLFDGASATLEQKQNLATQWYGIDNSDILIPMDTWVIDYGGMNLDMTKIDDILPENLLPVKDYPNYGTYYNNQLPSNFRV